MTPRASSVRMLIACFSLLLIAPSQVRAQAQPSVPAPARLPAQAMRQIEALTAEKRSRTAAQRKVHSRLLYGARMASGRPVAAGMTTLRAPLPMTADNRVRLDIRATVTDAVLNALAALGVEVTFTDSRYRHIAARARLADVESIAALPEVTSVAPEWPFRLSGGAGAALRNALQGRTNRDPQASITNTGSATSQGDTTHRAAEARTAFGVAGTGVKIGVLSDGVGGLDASQASGNLGPVTVLAGQAGSGSEGTAMLEIIADLAPGAQLFFATAHGGAAAFAQNIRALRNAGCDIIVDDVEYLGESPFQDGQVGSSFTNGGVVIQAVKDVTASGALYFSSAGNSGRANAGTSGTWEGDFVDGGPSTAIGVADGRLHRFGTQTFNTLTVAGNFFNALSWSDPLGASNNDYDLYVLDSVGTIVEASTDVQNGTQDPFEFVGGGFNGDQLVIVKDNAAASRFLHLATFGGVLQLGTGGAIQGHAATTAPNSFGVAATPACGGAGSAGPCTSTFTSANRAESFSSDGPRRIFFTGTGAAITPGNFSSTGGQVLNKPDITAADGVSTSVSGFTSFFGTSAAAPHAAAIAGLVKSANLGQTAAQVSSRLFSTVIDIHGAGWDRDSGFGIAMAFQSVQGAVPPLAPAAPTGLVILRTSPSTAVASWNAVSGATSYTLKFSFTSGAPKSPIVTIPGTSIGLAGLVRGQRYFFVVSASNASGSSADSPEVFYFVPLQDTRNDFDGDGRADLTVWRPGNATWFWLHSSNGTGGAKPWGASTDRPLSGDIDGDGKADLIVWRPSSGTFFWLTSSTGYNYANQASKAWGVSTDVPFVDDIDGDGRSELIVWRPSSGTFFWLTSSSGYDYAAQAQKQWGNASLGDVPMLGDFDGDRRADLAVWRASSGVWFWLTSSTGYNYANQANKAWGNQSLGDVPRLGDFDGDGIADLAVWRASSGTWFWLTSTTGYNYANQGSKPWGSQGQNDVPLLADLDGDGRAELIVWRPGNGTWFWLTAASNYEYAAQSQRAWGTLGDMPIVR